MEEGGIVAAKISPKGSKPQTKQEREQAANKAEKARADARKADLAQRVAAAGRSKDIDKAFAAWSKAEDKARRNLGPDVPTKAGHSRKKGDKIRNK